MLLTAFRPDAHAQKRGNSRGGGHGGGDKRTKRDAPPRNWLEEGEMHNADFEEYYKEQGIVPEGEWDAFMTTLRKALPVTFRINGGGRFADYLRDKMQSDFFSHFSNGDIMVRPMHARMTSGGACMGCARQPCSSAVVMP